MKEVLTVRAEDVKKVEHRLAKGDKDAKTDYNIK